jgi:hypothetical protein
MSSQARASEIRSVAFRRLARYAKGTVLMRMRVDEVKFDYGSGMSFDQFGGGPGKAGVADLSGAGGMMATSTPNMPSMMMGANLVSHGMMGGGTRPPFMNNNKGLRMRGGGRGRGM